MVRLNRILSIAFATVLLIVAAVGIAIAIGGVSSLSTDLRDLATWLDGRDLENWEFVIGGISAALAVAGVVLVALEFRSAEKERVEATVTNDELTFRAVSGEKVTLSSELVKAQLVDDLLTLQHVTDADARLTSTGTAVDVSASLGIDREAQIASVTAAASARIAETIENRLGMPLNEKPSIAMHLTAPKTSAAPATNGSSITAPRTGGV